MICGMRLATSSGATDAVTWALVAAATAWCAWLSGGYFLSDDLGWLANFARWSEQGRLTEEVLRRFAGGIERGDAMWRPFTYATYATSYATVGTEARGWLAVNLGLHLANAVLVGAMVARFAPGARAGAIFAAVTFFALSPGWEVPLWIASRYDAFAAFFTLVAGWWYAGERPRLALAAVVLALLSKESGAVALVLVGCLAIARELEEPKQDLVAAGRSLVARLWPFVALAVAYLLLRQALFGQVSRVYPGQVVDLASASHWANLWESAAAWKRAVFPGVPGTRTAAALATLGLLVVGIVATRGAGTSRAGLLAVLGALAVTTLLMLRHLAGLEPLGAGGRLLYLPGAMLAIALGLSLNAALNAHLAGAMRTLAVSLAAASLATNLYWMVRAGQEYREVHQAMRSVASGIATIAAGVSESPALVLIPDSLGRAPFGRNAQGALMLPPVQHAPLSARVLVQLDTEIPELPGKVSRGLFDWLMSHDLFDYPGDASALPGMRALEPSAYFCWNGAAGRFERMAVGDGTLSTLAGRIAAAYAKAGCRRKLGA